MDLYRLRVEIPDQPGCIGRVLVALGRLDVNVVEIDCHNVDGDVRVDDLFIHATRPTDLPAIAHAAEEAQCRVLEIRTLAVHDLEDPVTRSMRFVARLATAELVTDDLISWCAGQLLRADLACVIDSSAVNTDSVAGKALAGGVAVHEREWVKRLSAVGVRPWALAMPFDHSDGPAVVVVFRTRSAFTRTETARLRALCDAASTRSGTIVAAAPSSDAGPSWDIY